MTAVVHHDDALRHAHFGGLGHAGVEHDAGAGIGEFCDFAQEGFRHDGFDSLFRGWRDRGLPP